jgi:hypothetical protein
LKLWEQLANHPGTGAALIVLLASASNGAGGGDLTGPAIIGAWRGDRIAMVGDYDNDSKYRTSQGEMTGAEIYQAAWLDISDEVCAVLEKELDGKYSGDDWRTWTPNEAGPPDAENMVEAVWNAKANARA